VRLCRKNGADALNNSPPVPQDGRFALSDVTLPSGLFIPAGGRATMEIAVRVSISCALC